MFPSNLAAEGYNDSLIHSLLLLLRRAEARSGTVPWPPLGARRSAPLPRRGSGPNHRKPNPPLITKQLYRLAL
jgi:hypothetical protein